MSTKELHNNTEPHLKYKQEKEKSGLRSTGWYSIHNPQNPWKLSKEKKRHYKFYNKKWICNTHYEICNTCYIYVFSEIEKDMMSYSDTRLEWLKHLCNTNAPGKTQPHCACLQNRGFVGHQTGIKKTHKIKKEKRNLKYLHNRQMTTKLVFNFLILELCNGLGWEEPY